MRTACKKVLTAVEANDLPAAQAALKQAISVLATTAQKKIIHRKTASRQTSRLNAKVKSLVMPVAAS